MPSFWPCRAVAHAAPRLRRARRGVVSATQRFPRSRQSRQPHPSPRLLRPATFCHRRPATFRSTAPSPAAAAPIVRKTRWRKTTTTFGPFGRIACTLFLVVVLAVILVGGIAGDVFAFGGAAVWGFVIMPWALRDIWRAGQLPAR